MLSGRLKYIIYKNIFGLTGFAFGKIQDGVPLKLKKNAQHPISE
jgi:hypothetical protein